MNPVMPWSTTSGIGAPLPRDDRGAACHGFDQAEPERFRPVDRMQKGQGAAEQLVLFCVTDLAQEIDEGMVQIRLDLRFEIILVVLVHFCRYFERDV